jgi:hypothetical protein
MTKAATAVNANVDNPTSGNAFKNPSSPNRRNSVSGKESAARDTSTRKMTIVRQAFNPLEAGLPILS